MAATPGRLTAVAVGLLLALSACSDPDPDAIIDEAIAEADVTSTTTTPTTTSSTTTSEPTNTTLSEQEAAEAEIRRVVLEFHQFPIDSSLGEEGLGLEHTTGLLRQRVIEYGVELDADDIIHRSREPAPIEITGISIDIERGIAEVDACTGLADEYLDAETLELLSADDPSDTSTSVFQLQLVDGRWKINEWLPSGLNGDPTACEVAA